MRLVPLLLVCLATASHAAETRKPNVIYYPVHGASAKAIKDDIIQHGPRIGGRSAFSFTIPAIKVSKKAVQSGGSCHFKTYRIASVYNFVLPRLAATKGLPRQTQTNWNAFSSYLKAHENQHRQIWLTCLSEFENEARALEASSCDSLEKAATRAFERKKLACLEEDQRLDFYYTKEVLKLPFMREAAGK